MDRRSQVIREHLERRNGEGIKMVDNFLEASLDASLALDEMNLNSEVDDLTDEQLQGMLEVELEALSENEILS